MVSLRGLRIVLLSLLLLTAGWVLPAVSMAAPDQKTVDFLDDDFYENEPDIVDVGDPLESFNRAMFEFNDIAFTWVFNPVATGYSYVIPADIRGSVDNFFSNLQEPLRFINTLLQGRFSDSGAVLTRFVINTIGGVGGLGDPAGRGLGYPRIDATLGETLEVWGVHDGFYLVVPFFGPTTVRDFSGNLVEVYAMSAYYNWTDGWEETAAIYLFEKQNKLSLHLGEYEEMKQLSFDPYVAVRNGYFQHRKQKRDHSVRSYDN
ncbi:MAG: VacJ family lipoprotein [Desulfobulbus sp.]|nr:MAG: VacJ family lipoprotein [Desulfobulbus sp.]